MAEHPTAGLPHVLFALGNEYYAVPVHSIREVAPYPTITPVPLAPDHIKGVTNLRGQVITVVDLRRRLHLPETSPTARTRMAVAELDGELVGLIVDAVLGVHPLPDAGITRPADLMTTSEPPYIRGIAKWTDRVVTLLALEVLIPKANSKMG